MNKVEKYWQLTPVTTNHRAWKRSTLIEEIIVLADSEKESRYKAAAFLDKACKRETKFNETVVVSPWKMRELVIAVELDVIPDNFPKTRIIFRDDTRDKFS